MYTEGLFQRAAFVHRTTCPGIFDSLHAALKVLIPAADVGISRLRHSASICNCKAAAADEENEVAPSGT
jgi:hypothetical protein